MAGPSESDFKRTSRMAAAELPEEGLDVVAMPVGGSERVSLFLSLEKGPVRDEILAALDR